jgi:hypothetical protein
MNPLGYSFNLEGEGSGLNNFDSDCEASNSRDEFLVSWISFSPWIFMFKLFLHDDN